MLPTGILALALYAQKFPDCTLGTITCDEMAALHDVLLLYRTIFDSG